MNNKLQTTTKHGIDLKKGDILKDTYLVLSHISSGGTSEVYLVEEKKQPEKRWALKVSKISNRLSKGLVHETTILSELEHPNLPYVVDYFKTEKYYFLVMEYINGVALSDYFKLFNQQLPVKVTLTVAKQLCEILDYLHSQKPYPIIYRDIKPGNILIMDNQTIKLIDFGTAKPLEASRFSDAVQVGTVGFAAPEQYEKKQTDERTDLYSFGALLYYLLSSGKYVSAIQYPMKSLEKSLPKSLKKCVEGLIEPNPEKRVQSVKEVRKLLMKAEEELNNGLSKPRRFKGGSISLLFISIIFVGFLIYTFT